MPVTLTDVQSAAARIAPLIRRTPVVRNEYIDARAGREVYLKCENLQRGGSFKLRGAMNFLYSLEEADLPRGVVAFSSGNHAQAVAIAAKSRNACATIVMPQDAPQSKRQGTEAQGARVVTYDRHREDRAAIARSIAAETGAAVIPPFDHPWIIAGQGTTALELLEQAPPLDALVVCLGGGGLLSGCALAMRGLSPNTKLYGVEPEAGNDYVQSLKAGHPIEIASPDTIADGLRTVKPGNETFPLVQSLVDDVVTVSDDQLRDTMKLLLTSGKLLAEPSGAAALAAVLHGKIPAEHKRVGVTISGGNVDFEMIASL